MKPILFNTEMVEAILDGRKTVTRRIAKPQPILIDGFWRLFGAAWSQDNRRVFPMRCQSLSKRAPYKEGDILYVRETWTFVPCVDCRLIGGECQHEKPETYETEDEITEGCYFYKEEVEDSSRVIWHPSIHMPKKAARVFLRVTDVHLEQLQTIGREDALREGASRRELKRDGCRCCNFTEGCMGKPCGNREAYEDACHIQPFGELWDSTMKAADREKFGWSANPWVWVIEFERTEKPKEETT